MTYPSFKACERRVLVGLLEFYHENDSGEFLTVEDIKELCGLTISKIMIFKVIDSLQSRQLIEVHVEDQSDPLYSLTIKGIESAERAASSLDAASKAISTVPAADRVVTFDDNEANRASSAIDDAIEVIRTSNTVDQEQKSWLRNHLEVGKVLIKAKNVTTAAIRSLLLQPLYSAWKVVGEDVGKQALLAAIKTIKSLAGWL